MSSSHQSEWTRILDTTTIPHRRKENSTALTTGNDGSIYIAGHTYGDLDDQRSSGLYEAFFIKYNTDGTREWTRLLGAYLNDYADALTTGSDGSIYIAGSTYDFKNASTPSAKKFDGQTNSGEDDAFISKYNSDGTKDWTKLFGTSEYDGVYALTTGGDGSIYIAGYTRGNLDGLTNSGADDVFIRKYNSDGTKDWTRVFGSSSFDEGYALTTGSDGSIYIAGKTGGNDLDGQTNSGVGAFIRKYNSDGTKDWTKILGSGRVYALTTGGDGSIYISGYTSDDLDGQTNSGGQDAFISKYNPDGTVEWTRLLGTSVDDEGHALTIGSDGSIYIAGKTGGDLDGQTNSGGYDAFISKYNSDGTKDWTKLLGTSGDDEGHALTTGNDGSIYIAGHISGDLDGQTYDATKGVPDTFISKISNLFSPVDISLSSTSFNENIDAGSTIATLSTTDEDASDSFTYTLVSGTEGTDNDSFTIDASNLKISTSPDYETKSSYSVRIKTTDSGGFSYEEAITLSVNDLIDTGIKVADINENYTPNSKGFSSISGSAPVTVTAYDVGSKTTLNSIKDYGGNLHAGDTLENTASSYKYHGLLDVNGDGVFEGIFTNNISRRWVTAKVDSLTGQVDYGDHGNGGGTRVVGIYEDPLIAEGEKYGGFLSDRVTPAPAAYGATGTDRYVDLNGDGDFDDDNEDRLALNSQVRFQNDLENDNLTAKHSGDYDGDGIHEVYWKTNDGDVYLRSLMHADGNIRYANYQNQVQMSSYLTGEGHSEIISDIL